MKQIAKVLKSNGSDGEVILGFQGPAPEDINQKEPVFVEFDSLPVPFYFESFSVKGNTKAVVRLTGVHDLRDAEELVGRPVFSESPAFDDDEEDLTGWTILDAKGRKVGVISGTEPIPGNPCVYVDTGTAEVLVPLSEDLILAVDEEGCIIRMDIPEGLI